MGWYIFLYERHGETAIKHETGHSKQPQYLGLLYLLVVGIYSASLSPYQKRHLAHLTDAERDGWYFSRWTEKWADRLGGVVRVFR